MVITGETDWGGWRVPGAEYDLDPVKIERQAQMIAAAPKLAAFARALIDWARKSGEEMPAELADLAHERPGRDEPRRQEGMSGSSLLPHNTYCHSRRVAHATHALRGKGTQEIELRAQSPGFPSPRAAIAALGRE